MNDLLEVKKGKKKAHEVRPCAYGELAVPIDASVPALGGAAFDPATGQLYLTVQKAADAQGQ